MKITLFLMILLTASSYAAVKSESKKEDSSDILRPPLNLDQEVFLSNTNGILIPKALLGSKVRDNIRIFLPDGTSLSGYIKSIEIIDNKMFKFFGEITNKPNTGFGFVLTSEGIFAGAVVFRDEDLTYTVKYNEEAKGFTLVRSLTGKKLTSSNRKKFQKVVELF